MITACDELAHYVACLSERDAEAALDLLRGRFDPPPTSTGPCCPACSNASLELLVWQELDDGAPADAPEDVCCHSCGHVWAPNAAHALAR